MSYGGDRGRGRGRGDRGGGGGDRGRGDFDRGRGGRGASPSGRGSPGGDRGRGDGYRGRGRGFGGGGGGGGREQGGVYAADRPANVDARLDNSQDALIASLSSLSLRSDEPPLRPGWGTTGQPVKLRANFFSVRVPKGPLHEYDVAITPAAGTARRVKRRIFQLAEQTPDWAQAGMRGTVAHDHGAKLISAKQLPQPLTIKVPFFDEDEDGPKPDGKEYTLTITFIQELETQSLVQYLHGQPQYRGYDILPVIAALNIVLAAHPSRAGPGGGVMVGRNRFFFPSPSERPISLGGGLEAWRGFYSSVRPAYKQLMVNVNVATTAFYKPGNLALAMLEFRNATFGARVNVFVRHLRVKTTHLGYKKTVKTLAKQNAREYKFQCAELGNRMVTVEEYFKSKYRKTLQYPELPLVDVGGGGKGGKGGKKNNSYLPAEVCEILPSQPYRGKLTEEHTANMITAACKPPNINAAFIENRGLDELGFRQTASPLGAFGISIGSEMTVVPGRILPSPGIKYRQGNPRVDERASWNLRDVKFAIGGRLEKWAVLVIQDGGREEFRGADDPDLRETISKFAQMCRTSGMTVDQVPPSFVTASLPRKDFSDPIRAKAIGEIRKSLMTLKPKPTFALVILSSGDKNVYSGLKHLCDSYLDLPTTCVHAAKIKKNSPQYFANVALKVNMKMGGVNHNLDSRNLGWLQKGSTMLVGMDVTHPGPGSVDGTPSIAAVVASVDNNYGQFPASMRIQETKKEMITELAGMMVERLKLYQKRNKQQLPERVLVYRDGVSEGQFGTVVAEELPEIRKAFTKFDTPNAPYRPKLSIVICGKRHHTRFYPTEASAADRDGNPRPGTVVDRGVTAVYNFDFFLQAHGGLQGTTRPTHYYVVHDENKFKADELQVLTNGVSYLFARATKAVSLVSPAYYADLACERGRCYLHRLLQGHSQSNTTTASGPDNHEAVWHEAETSWHGGLANGLKDTMFYL